MKVIGKPLGARVLAGCLLVMSLAVSFSTPVEAGSRKSKLDPSLLRGKYILGGSLVSIEGSCNLIDAQAIVGSRIVITTKRSRVQIHSIATMSGRLKRNGSYSGYGIRALAPGVSAVTETVKGKFQVRGPKNRVQFRGIHSFETVSLGTRDCLARYLVVYR